MSHNRAADIPAPTQLDGSHAINIVDCDVHPKFRNGLKDLFPFLPTAVRNRLGLGLGMVEYGARHPHSGTFGVPGGNSVYINVNGGQDMADSLPPGGGPPASDPQFVREQLLDGHGVDRAILLTQVFGFSILPDPDMAAALVAAYNDWVQEKWLAVDHRFRSALSVAVQDPAQAVAEIERVADRPGVVAVNMHTMNALIGERQFHPIYAAAARHGLPVCVHCASGEGIWARGAAAAVASPTFQLEYHTRLYQPLEAHLISLVCHGVFEKFPGLKVVIVEGGVGWLPALCWRFDSEWKSLRAEVPWLKQRPSEYIFDHVRLTTQPLSLPEKREHQQAFLEMVQADRTLLFATDYPHWDFDDPKRALQSLPAATRRRVLADNALELFGDRLL